MCGCKKLPLTSILLPFPHSAKSRRLYFTFLFIRSRWAADGIDSTRKVIGTFSLSSRVIDHGLQKRNASSEADIKTHNI
jgi:hypothetical protein